MEYLPSNLPYKSAKCRYSKYTCTFQFGCQMVPLQGVNSTCSLGFDWHPLEGAGTMDPMGRDHGGLYFIRLITVLQSFLRDVEGWHCKVGGLPLTLRCSMEICGNMFDPLKMN